MELKKFKKQGWSTSTYSGEVPEEMRWKHQENTRNSPDVLFARFFNIGCQMFYICQMF